MKKLTQSGFTAIEALLIVIILAIIGGTGYYVWHANKNASNTLKTTSSNQDNTPNGGKGGGDPNAQTGPAKTEVYIIKEWNVSSAIPTPPLNAALIQYQMDDTTPASASFTTQELIDVDSACSADKAPGGIISRAAATDPFYGPDGAPSGQTVEQTLTSSNTFKPYKKVGSYYYWYTPAQSACSTSSKIPALQSAASAQVKQIVTHLEQE